MLNRRASELDVKIMRITQGESSAAFNKEMRNRILPEFAFSVIQFLEFHGVSPRLKENIPIKEFSFPIEVMLEVKTGISRHEQIPLAQLVAETPDAVICGAMFVVRGVVPNDGFQVSES